MTLLKMLSTEDKLAEIRRLYFNASKHSIQQDLAKALDLLKSMSTEDERERAAVYMEGLAEMRNDWLRERASKGGGAGAGKGDRRKDGTGGRKKSAPKPARKR
jgi:hypothetical protein